MSTNRDTNYIMKYRVNITVSNQRGEELVDKVITITDLENIPNLDLGAVYAEAVQNELTDGPIEYDETLDN